MRLPLRAVETDRSQLIKEQVVESRDLLNRLPALKSLKVLVVDDEASTREIITG